MSTFANKPPINQWGVWEFSILFFYCDTHLFDLLNFLTHKHPQCEVLNQRQLVFSRIEMSSGPCNAFRLVVVSLLLTLALGSSLSRNTQKGNGGSQLTAQEVSVSLLFVSLLSPAHIYGHAAGRGSLKSAALWPTSQASVRCDWPGRII